MPVSDMVTSLSKNKAPKGRGSSRTHFTDMVTTINKHLGYAYKGRITGLRDNNICGSATLFTNTILSIFFLAVFGSIFPARP